MSTDERMKLADKLQHAMVTMQNDDMSQPGTEKRQRHAERYEVMADAVAALRAPEAADAGAVATREAIARIIDPTAKFEDIEGVQWSRYEVQRRDDARSKADAILALIPTAAGIAAPPAYVNPVDTHDWEKQLDKDGNWNLNSVCRRCKCELMPAFRGVSDEGTSPCPVASLSEQLHSELTPLMDQHLYHSHPTASDKLREWLWDNKAGLLAALSAPVAGADAGMRAVTKEEDHILRQALIDSSTPAYDIEAPDAKCS